MELYKKIVDIFSLNGEIHSSINFLSKNELLLLISKRNEILRSIGFINGNFVLNGDSMEIFEDPTIETIEANTSLIMAVIAPILYDIITNKSKEFPDFMLAVNASGRMNFLKGLVSLVHSHAEVFDNIDLIISSETLRDEILKLKRFFGTK
ncbi:MAG TPA: hypothetical protein VI912_01045 [Candidatus Bilamarchaeaceae archaeon]|nr:hypothetical protein [Candidatus Bilamarchaeaceae archaeon]